MKRFAQLFAELDATTATGAKVDALKRYFAHAAPADAAWAVFFLAGGKPRQAVPTSVLKALACRRAGIDEWLFEACYHAVGDLAETIAHVLPPAHATRTLALADWMNLRLLPLRTAPADEQATRITAWWDELDGSGRFLLTKLIGGGFRVGVSKLLVQRALAEHAGIDAKRVAQRMMGYTDKTARPDAAAFLALVAGGDDALADSTQPFPFFLAHALEVSVGRVAASLTNSPASPPTDSPADALAHALAASLGPPSDWLVEWKYDGIRAQLVRRGGQVAVWSRGEELLTDRFPELLPIAHGLPDGTVLDGEILVWRDERPAPFSLLQQRIARKTLTKKLLTEVPVTFMAYDLLAWQGVDLREQPQQARRDVLETAALTHGLRLSPAVRAADWGELAALRATSRERGVEGFMLKHRAARYGSGRRKQDDLPQGAWWKWKIDPLTVDAVLIYAQAGHGRRASLYTDYTFAVWNRAPHDATEAAAVIEAIAQRQPAVPGALQLVAFAKAYSGLSDAEIRDVDRVIRQTTLEKFGPVRSVRPTLVFELGFEGINRSPRHKSGVAVRFPRILRIRHDKPLAEADTLPQLERLLS